MAVGVRSAGTPEYLLFTDADVRFPPNALTALVAAAGEHRLDLLSQMVRLRAEQPVGAAHRSRVRLFLRAAVSVLPGEPARVDRGRRRRGLHARPEGGAGGGRGLARIAAERRRCRPGAAHQGSPGGLSDLARAQPDIQSVRPYSRLADLWAMVSRSAYTQLRYSPWLLAGTAVGLLLGYVVPPMAAVVGFIGGDAVLATLGGAGWAIMAATYVPMLRFYGLSPARSVLLPVIAVGYLAMTRRFGPATPARPRWRLEGPNRRASADDHLADPRQLLPERRVDDPRAAEGGAWRRPSPDAPRRTRR